MKTSRLSILRKIIVIVILGTMVITGSRSIYNAMVSNNKYKEGEEFVENGKFKEAIAVFEDLGEYKDSTEKVKQASLALAEELLSQEDMVHAAMAYGKAGEYDMSCEVYWDKVTQRRTMYATRSSVIAVKTDGTVVFAGDNIYGEEDVREWTNIVAVSGYGDRIIVGLKADGTVVSNHGYEWEIGDFACDMSDWTDIIAISADYYNVIGMKADGTVVSADKERLDFSQWNDIVNISCSNNFVIGLKSDGMVLATEIESAKQRLKNFIDLSDMVDCTTILPSCIYTEDPNIYFYDVIGIKQNGTIVTASNSNEFDYSDILEWTDIKDISCDFCYASDEDFYESGIEAAGLKYDGTVVSTGMDVDVSSWTDIVAISISPTTITSGDNETAINNAAIVGLKSDGTLIIAGKEDEFDLSGFTDIKVP